MFKPASRNGAAGFWGANTATEEIMKTNIFDLETEPDFEAVSKFTPPFDRDSVKVGNLKPENALAKINEAEAEYWSKAHEKAALNPATSKIVAIGIHIEDTTSPMMILGDEKEILAAFWDEIAAQSEHDQWASFSGNNGRGQFDVRHLLMRSWINRVPVPHGLVSNRGYISNKFIDLAEVFLAGADSMSFVSANMVARQLNLIGTQTGFATVLDKDELAKKHGVSGANFWEVLKSDEQLARVYLENDLAIERAIANVII